jgi:cytochrome bd ubiquinol oxidase subunit I
MAAAGDIDAIGLSDEPVDRRGSVEILHRHLETEVFGHHVELAKRSATVAASFGLAAALSVVVLGDESGYTAGENQKMKIAAIEAMWNTEPAPASFTIFGLPNQATHTTDYEIRIPWMLGLIATRSLSGEVPGINELVAHAQERIRSGLVAYDALAKVRADRGDSAARSSLEAHGDDLGYALLLKKIRPDIGNASDAQIAEAAENTAPAVSPIFWSFRIMVALGLFFIGLFTVAFYLASARRLQSSRVFLWIALIGLPLPWIAGELGWYVAEVGRQPWVIEGVLPIFLAISSLSAANVLITLVGFIAFYSALLVVDIYLMAKAIRLGPSPTRSAPLFVPSPIAAPAAAE